MASEAGKDQRQGRHVMTKHTRMDGTVSSVPNPIKKRNPTVLPLLTKKAGKHADKRKQVKHKNREF